MKLVDRVLRRFGYGPLQKRNGGFAAALQSRLTSDWITPSGGPNAELFASIGLLRSRARDLEKNNALVRRYLNLLAENVVGPKGITLQARTESKGNNDRIESAWREWCAPTNLSVDGRLGWASFTQAAVRGLARDGEILVRKVYTGPYGFALQLIDPALLDENFNRVGNGGATIKMGVELDAWDRPLAYHVLTGHRYDVGGAAVVERVRIPADELLHLFVQRRPGQIRGESWLAPVMIALRHLDGYTEAEIIAARTAAAKMGFITRKGEDGAGPDPEAERSLEMEGAPGTIEVLGDGEDFKSWDPSHPSQNFALFVKQVTKFIASGLNVTYMALANDSGDANFAQGRLAVVQERDGYRIVQQLLIEGLCDPVYRAWRDYAYRKGYLPLRMTPDNYAHQWQPRGWAYTNPREEQVADMLAVAAGFTSRRRVLADNGEDFEDVLNELAEEQKLIAAAGVDLYVPNSVMDPDAQDTAGSADPNADAGAGGEDGGGRADPRLALIRSAR